MQFWAYLFAGSTRIHAVEELVPRYLLKMVCKKSLKV